MQKENSKSMKQQVDATFSSNLNSPCGPEYGFINNEGYYQTYPAIEPEVKINQHIVVMDGKKTHNCKVISFNKKTRLIEIKINKKPAMCFKYANGGYYLVSKNPNK